jgi:hypothetical protein
VATRKRPASVPTTATFDPEHRTWSDGPSRGGVKKGKWTYWHAGGELMGSVRHDANGERHGPCRWLHANGELWQEGRYEDGKLAGKISWLRPAGKLPKYMAWFDQLGKQTARFEVPYAAGEQERRHFTFYNAAGRDEPIAADSSGRSIELGRQMHKVQPETVMFLVEDDFECHGGDGAVHAGSISKLARGEDVARGRYLYVGSPHDGVHVLRFKPEDGPHEEWYVEAHELDRAFTLAADYFGTAQARLAKASRSRKPPANKRKPRAATKRD